MTLVKVLFEWDNSHGPCDDCGGPATAFCILGMPEIKLCAVCAANRAVDGDDIRRISAESNESTTQEYTVTWVINEEAESPEAAARQARARMLNPGSIADVFNVAHMDGSPIGDLAEDSVDIDLSALDGRPTG